MQNVLKNNNPSSNIVTQFSNNENKKEKEQPKSSGRKEVIDRKEVVEVKKNIQPQSVQQQQVKNTVVSSNNSSNKKKESDLKDISDFMGKKKENRLSNPNARELINKESSKDRKEEKKPSSKNINVININTPSGYNSNVSTPSSSENSLREFMKKRKAEIKSQPAEDIVWLGAKAEKETPKKEEKERRFPKITIIEDKKPADKNKDLIEINNVKPLPEKKLNKDEEEFYNLNRYLYELAVNNNFDIQKLDNNEEETIPSNEDTSENYEKNVDINDDRDFNIIDDTDDKPVENVYSQADISTDNSQIEELRIELENSLGMEVFKLAYDLVDNQVINNINIQTDVVTLKCDFEMIQEGLKKSLTGRINRNIIDQIVSKIPEVFTIVLKERLSNVKY